jgi:adenylyltransferase/sulfurtransferase
VFPGGGPGGIVPVAGAAAGAVGSLQALEAIKFLLGARETLSGGLVFFDGESLELRRMGLRRDPSCPACGGSPAKGRAAPP